MSPVICQRLKLFSRQSRMVLMVLALAQIAVPVTALGAGNAQQAAQIALQKNTGAKVLGVSEQTDSNGRKVFAVKIISENGRVRVIRIPQS